MFFGKQKFDVKQLKLNKFIFDVKQLKMNRFIKSISDLIISTLNATLEIPVLQLFFISGLSGDAISNFRLLDLGNSSFN